MTEPLLRIVARFDINEEQRPGTESGLDGRAYLSAFNFKEAYNGDLVYAVKHLRTVVQSPELAKARKGQYDHTIAIMWGDNNGNPMIDFLVWKCDNWEENAEISAIPIRAGKIIQPNPDGSLPVTCEGGARDILDAEIAHRKQYGPGYFRAYGPNVSVTGLRPVFDFSKPDGRELLRNLLDKNEYIILNVDGEKSE